MVNLIRNENMKIYFRARTWIMIGILLLIVAAFSFVYWYDIGRDLSGEDWRAHMETQIEHNAQILADEQLPEEMKADIKSRNQVLQYQLDHHIKPQDATMWGPVMELAFLVFFITLFGVIVAGDNLAGEFSTGTIKLLLIRPASRTKILVSKYIAAILFGILLLLLLFISSLLFSGIWYGFSGWSQPLVEVNDAGVLQEKSMVGMLWSKYLFNFVSTVMYVTMAFMISAVFRSSAMAIGFSIFTMFIGDLVTMILSRYEWSKYLLFANIDLTQYTIGTPFMEGMTMGFSIAVLAAYFIFFHLLAWTFFTKRDVAA